MLGWMFKAEEFGVKQLLKQLKAANLLSYAAVEDIITTGMASPLLCPAQFAALATRQWPEALERQHPQVPNTWSGQPKRSATPAGD